MAQAQFTKQITTPEFEALFPTDDACKTYLQGRRWPVGVSCPRCGNEKVATISDRAFLEVSAKYLPLYVAEFEFRYNNRNTADIFDAAVARC